MASPTSAPSVISPMSRPSVKNESIGTIQDYVAGDQSDVESRFSGVDKSDELDEDNVEWWEMKRRRLDLSSKEYAMNDALWSVNRNDIQFNKNAILNKSLFHLNPFINGNLKRNSAFYLFLREGIATPGFYPLPKTIDVYRIASLTHS